MKIYHQVSFQSKHKFDVCAENLVVISVNFSRSEELGFLPQLIKATTTEPWNPPRKTSSAEMKRLLFPQTTADLEIVNDLVRDDISAIVFATNLQDCNSFCKQQIGDYHVNNHVMKYEKSSGKCVCFLLNKNGPWHELNDVTWTPRQNSVVYAFHRKFIGKIFHKELQYFTKICFMNILSIFWKDLIN